MQNEVSPDPRRFRAHWVLGIVLFALLVRLYGLDYDQNHHFHPDERAIADAIGRLSFNPSHPQLNPKFFAYGSFPLYVFGIAAGVLSHIPGLRGYDESILIGRGVSAVAGTLTVLLLIALGTRLYDRRVGLLAGFLLGACVLHVQNSHFMTTDIFLTLVVLVALHFLIGLVQHGRTTDYVLSGLAIGFAGATKFSALPLLAPLGIAVLVRLYRERRPLPILGKALLAMVAIGAAFFVGQPYALLDFETFRHHIDEQSNMVRHAGLLPYTNQYIGVPKYLYEIQEMVLWCMGPALGLVALWGTAARTVSALRERSGENLVLLSWVIPYFAVTGWFEVKFVRYLLPIYPILVLWGAAWLVARAERSRLGRAALWAVIGVTVAYLLAFMSIYQRDHTAVTASDWVYRHVPKKSTLLTQHWDEGFPFHLEGRPSLDVEVEELPYYDGEQKMRSITKKLAEADFLALQTKRLYGAVTRAPEKYRLTNNYFYLLFAGDLGYKLVYDYASRPSLFGIELPDELADESITVYDHPKVVIFENAEHLSADDIFARVTRGMPSRKLDRTDLLLARADAVPGAEQAPAALIRSSWNATLRFALLIEVLGLAFYPVLRRVLQVPGAYALSKVLGVLAFAWVPWLLTSFAVTEFRGSTLAVVFLIFVLASLPAWRAERRRLPAELWPTELLFWGTFGFFLMVRAFNPEVYWGEKPMDFSFLNALQRSVHLPPPEPWFAGSTLHYSYFGHYLVAALGKVCNIHPGVTFNLGVALFAGLTAAAAFGAGCALGGRWRVGLLAALLTTLLGNLAGPRNVLDRLQRGTGFGELFNFDYFWATSRVIKDTINEYPFWSFLFADLHAHALVMPFSLSFLALALWWVKRDEAERPIRALPLLFLLGLTLGAIMVTNTWSTFVYAAFFPFLLGTTALARSPRRRGQLIAVLALVALLLGLAAFQQLDPALARHWEEALHFLGGRALRPFAALELAGVGLAGFILLPGTVFASAAVLAVAYGLYYPYWHDWSAPPPNWGLEGDAFANAYDFTTIFGLFLWIAVPFLFAFWRRQLLGEERERLDWPRRLSLWLVGGAILVCLLLTLPYGKIFESSQQLLYFLRIGAFKGSGFTYETATLASVRVGLVLLAVLALHLGLSRSAPPRRRTIAALLSFAFFVTAGVDVVHVWDRMNTVFKFYLESWFVFSVASAAAVYELRAGMIRSPKLAWLWRAGYMLLLVVAGFTVITATRGVISTKRVETPRPSLDGTAYLALRDPHENAAFEWINREIPGIPVIAEAYGPSYQEYARVSMNTGLPTVIGWDYHVHQRAHDWPDINRRKEDVKRLYTTESEPAAREILKTYHVALVYVGKLERREYNGGNLTRFQEWGDLLTPVYENAGVSIFAVQGQYTGATPMQTIEDVPQVAAAGGGEEGEAPAASPQGQLTQPRGIDVDAAGNVYVADFGNDRIQVFDAQLKFARTWGDKGNLPGQFKQPGDVAVAPSGTIYVADTWNQRIQVFKPDGQYLYEFGNALFGPRGIAIDRGGTVFLVDTGNHRVRRFSANGTEETNWGGVGSEPGQLKEPVGVAVDGAGRVYVCDTGNGRVQIFSRDGKLESAFPVEGWELKVFSEPHIVVSESGVIWLTVPLKRSVRAYDTKGNVLHEITGTEDRSGLFQRPMGIALRSKEELVVSDLEGRLVALPIPPNAR